MLFTSLMGAGSLGGVYCRLEAGHAGEHWCEAEDEMSEELESEE